MKRTTISLPEELVQVVEYEAGRRGTSVSEVIRDSLTETLLPTRRRKLGFAAICEHSALPDASKLEESLEGWDDDIARRRR
jgi:Arc/MetJ-type ribon-helix-helix transcriptional regulator